MADGLTGDEVRRVLRRAAELDRDAHPQPMALDVEAVEQAAVEAGLSPGAVRRAVAELRAGLLAEGDRGVHLLGPRMLTLGRALPGPGGEVESVLHAFLGDELFEVRRDPGDRTEWASRQSLDARVRRTVDKAVQRKLVLRDVDRVEVRVVDEPGSAGARVLARLDLGVRQLVHDQAVLTGVGAVGGAGVAVAGAVAVGLDPLLLVFLPGGVGVAGVAHWVGARIYRARVDDIVAGVERVLDRLDRRRSSSTR